MAFEASEICKKLFSKPFLTNLVFSKSYKVLKIKLSSDFSKLFWDFSKLSVQLFGQQTNKAFPNNILGKLLTEIQNDL